MSKKYDNDDGDDKSTFDSPPPLTMTMMKQSVIAATMVATAAAFVPQHHRPNSGSCSLSTRQPPCLAASFHHEVGAQPPLGFYDPLGLLANGDQEQFDRLRYVEIKHGRISMLAVVGYLMTEADVRWPCNVDFGTPFDVVPSGFMAFRVLPLSITLQIFLTIGFLGTYFRQK